MKTITEFYGAHLVIAMKTVQELTAAGKTPEEIQQALMETLKLKEDKIKPLMTAMDVVKERAVGLKRVVVLQLDEKDKPPRNAEKRDDYYYLYEVFAGKPEAPKKVFGGRDDGGRGKKKGRGRSGDRQGDRRDRGPRGAPTGLPQPLGGAPRRVVISPTNVPREIPAGVAESAPGEIPVDAAATGAPGQEGAPQQKRRRRRPRGRKADAEGAPLGPPTGAPNLPKPNQPKAEAGSAEVHEHGGPENV